MLKVSRRYLGFITAVLLSVHSQSIDCLLFVFGQRWNLIGRWCGRQQVHIDRTAPFLVIVVAVAQVNDQSLNRAADIRRSRRAVAGNVQRRSEWDKRRVNGDK